MATNRSVLITINTSWNIYNFRGSLVRALRGAGYAVISVSPPDAYTERLSAMVDQHVDLPMDNAGTSLWNDAVLLWRYFFLLRVVRPSAVLAYTIKPNIYGTLAASFLGIPAIVNISGLGTTFIRRNWLTLVVKLLYRIALRRSKWVFFQNTEDYDLFLKMKLVSPEKASVLPGSGVDLDYFKPIERPVQQPVRFVLIARLLWDKGIGEYVEAARIVKASYPNTVMHLVGPAGVQNKTSISENIVREWVREGLIDYLGESDAVRDIIAEHDCVVLPSYREGLSRVLLEGAAMGKPLIATDVPGCRQVVDDGDTGFLCRPRDAESLAEAMIRFLNLAPAEKEAMGRRSREKAEKEFDEKRVLAAYLDKVSIFAK